jgi:hypothetical protein
MLTGLMTPQDEAQQAALQALACFEKPLQLEGYQQLVATLEKLLTTLGGTGEDQETGV